MRRGARELAAHRRPTQQRAAGREKISWLCAPESSRVCRIKQDLIVILSKQAFKENVFFVYEKILIMDIFRSREIMFLRSFLEVCCVFQFLHLFHFSRLFLHFLIYFIGYTNTNIIMKKNYRCFHFLEDFIYFL